MLKTIFFLFFTLQIFVQAQAHYLMKLTNPVQLNNKTLEFDLIIKSTGEDFSLSSYQCSFSFDLNIGLNDSIRFNYIENSSELDNYPVNVIGYDTTDGLNKLIFVSGIGNDLITSEEKLVGKFTIYSSLEFSEENLKLEWNFKGSANTIVTGDNFTNITDSLNHKSFDESALTEIVESEIIQDNFNLSQNYPNPFNPTTKINFGLPEKGIVKLSLFNIIGEKVMEILNGEFTAGAHSVIVDGSQLSSGVYIYKLSVEGKYSAVKKMILLK